MSFLFGWTKFFMSQKPPKERDFLDYVDYEDDDDEERDRHRASNMTDFEKRLDEMQISDDEIECEDEDEDDRENENKENETEKLDNTQPIDEHDDIKKDDDDDCMVDDHEDDACGSDFETLEEEIEFLRQQNKRLKDKYKYHKTQHNLLRHNFDKTGVMQMKINGKLVNIKQPHIDISLDELSEKVEARLPKFLQAANESTIVPLTTEHGNNNDSNSNSNSHEIGVIDLKSMEWGDLVKLNVINTADALAQFADNDANMQMEDQRGLSGPFLVLREEDVIDAIACFIAQCVMNIPECRNLDHAEMQKMISGTFSELRGKGPLGKMLDWGSFVYRSYGWTSTAYVVYSNAYLAKVLLSGLLSAAWVIGVL